MVWIPQFDIMCWPEWYGHVSIIRIIFDGSSPLQSPQSVVAGTSLVGHGKVRESILHDQDNSLSSLELKTCFTMLFSSTKYFTSYLIDVVSFPAKFV